jgi:cephalosporin-C deacetylase-like acetyl esterase
LNPYNYDKGTPEYKSYLVKENSNWWNYRIEFRSALDTGFPENSTVKVDYYLPKVKGKVPLAILVHGMGDFSVIPCRMLARNLLKQGIACIILYLTTHSKRIPAYYKKRMPQLTSEEWFESYRLSVIDIRQTIDWAYNVEEIDENRIVTIGLSLGGFITAIAMGIDSRISAGVFIVMSGNFPKMNRISKSTYYRKGYEQTESEYLETQSDYVKYIDDISEKGFENVTPSRQSFLTDPYTYAGNLKNRPVLMINALLDRYIPRETVNEFWQACGKPPIKWLKSGHVTLWLWYPIILRYIKEFMNSNLSVSSNNS